MNIDLKKKHIQDFSGNICVLSIYVILDYFSMFTFSLDKSYSPPYDVFLSYSESKRYVKKNVALFRGLSFTKSACFAALWITLICIIVLLQFTCLFEHLFMGPVLLSG